MQFEDIDEVGEGEGCEEDEGGSDEIEDDEGEMRNAVDAVKDNAREVVEGTSAMRSPGQHKRMD